MKTIAVSGKGGTGKTSIASLIVRCLSENFTPSILAVDADPNVNFNDLLGVKLLETIGAIREEMRNSVSSLPGGMTKQQFLEYKMFSGLVETTRFDLIAMGRPEGPGCYCYANNILRDILKMQSANYEYVVLDSEAGMEHLSRRVAQDIDYLFIISLPSVTAIRTAGRISRLLKELDSRVGEKYLVLNRTRGIIPLDVEKCIQEEKLSHFFSIPDDENIASLDQQGGPIWDLVADSPAFQAVNQMMEKLLKNNKIS